MDNPPFAFGIDMGRTKTVRQYAWELLRDQGGVFQLLVGLGLTFAGLVGSSRGKRGAKKAARKQQALQLAQVQVAQDWTKEQAATTKAEQENRLKGLKLLKAMHKESLDTALKLYKKPTFQAGTYTGPLFQARS